ncbi:unnamed protein product [Diamesa hyperborea]
MEITKEIMFGQVTKLMEGVSSAKTIQKREEYMQKFFEDLIKFQKDFKDRNKTGNSSLYPVIRMILSTEEQERCYNMQIKTITKLYIKALQIPEDGIDAKKLLHASKNEFPQVLNEVMKHRAGNGSISIYDVDAILNSFGDQPNQKFIENEFRKLMMNTSAMDQKWLVKILLRKANFSLGKLKVLDLYHPAAKELYQKYSNLSKVCELIETNGGDVQDIVAVYQHIRPMLCGKFIAQTLAEMVQTTDLYLETKFDGERFQLHIKDGTYRYYSRKGHDYSETYGTNKYNGNLTPLIANLFASGKYSIQDLILDGEMMVWNQDDKKYHCKGEGTDVKALKDKTSNRRPCFVAFDILYYNGGNQMDKAYSERILLLERLFEDREGVIIKSKPIRIRDIDHVLECLNNAMDAAEEGIVLKDAHSAYKPGERTEGWFKLKPDYFDGKVVKEFDHVIIGGLYANPHKKDYLLRYMLGAIEKQSDGTINVYSIGKVVHGLSVPDRKKLNEDLKSHYNVCSGEKIVEYDGGQIHFGYYRPDIWIPPNKSIVLEIRAAELAKSSGFYTGHTFRFPRVSSIRRDKPWDECCTLTEFKELCDAGGKVSVGNTRKIVMRDVNIDDVSPLSVAIKKRKTVGKTAISETFQQGKSQEEVVIIDEILKDIEYCVLGSGQGLPSKEELEKMIKQHGGSLTFLPRIEKTNFIVSGYPLGRRVEGYIKSQTYNIIHAEFIVKNFGGGILEDLPEITPKDVIFAKSDLKSKFLIKFDRFGDSHTEPIKNVEELEKLLDSMDDKKLDEVTDEDVDLLEMELDIGENIFRNIKGCFLTHQKNHLLFSSAQDVFESWGGKVVDLESILDEDGVGLVFVDRTEKSIMMELSKNCRLNGGRIVNFNWILRSFDLMEKNSKKL